MGKVTVFAGESGSGKSFVVSGNITRNAQAQGIFVVMVDTENALDEKWLKALDVDTSEEKMLRISASMIDEVAKVVHDFVTEYKENYLDLPREQRPKILFVIDSLGMLLTPTEVNQFQAGDMKGDFGKKARQLKAFVSNCVNMFGDLNIGMVVTNHTYASQDMFDPDDKISGGSGFMFASSIIVAMKKWKLKEDEEGTKGSEVLGIRSTCKVVKTRYSKPFESIKIDIPWETGMNPLSGLFDLFLKSGVLVKEGNSYVFTSKKTGQKIKQFKKAWNVDEASMKLIMDEFTQDDLNAVITDTQEEQAAMAQVVEVTEVV
jgi:RecA/RadA recombinase